MIKQLYIVLPTKYLWAYVLGDAVNLYKFRIFIIRQFVYV